MTAWTLLNLLCAAWVVLPGCVGMLVLREMHGARTWIPNRAAVLIDLGGLVLFAFAVGGGLVVGTLSIVLGKALWSALLNLAACLVVIAFVAASWLLLHRFRRTLPDVRPAERTRPAPSGEAVLVAGGDVSFDPAYPPSRVARFASTTGNLPITLSWLTGRPALPVPRLATTRRKDVSGEQEGGWVTVPSPPGWGGDPERPLRGLAPLFRDGDAALVNLENPLLAGNRKEAGRIAGDPAFTAALSAAGVGVVNLANNHCLDAGEAGLLSTLAALEEAGIGYTGAGRNLEEARAGHVTESGGMRVAWLGYTQKMGRVTMDYAVAGEDRPGCLPLDPDLVRRDIRAARERADVVVVTPHWGVENRHRASPVVRALGRWMIDAGADAVLGHGPHVYQGIEVRRGRPIVYSMGTLVFGYWERPWMDNLVVRLVIRNGAPLRLEIVPVAGTGEAVLRPEPLRGEAARSVLRAVAGLSRKLGTAVSVGGDVGVVDLSGGSR